MLRYFPALWILLLCAGACSAPAVKEDTDTSAAREAVLKADTDFSELSRKKGFRYAFLAYADSTAVLLRADNPPMEGHAAFKYIESMNDTGVTLTWEPSFASVANSGDMAYTYGVYTFAAKDTSTRGTYLTIWKKDAAGNWKFVLDTGNEGLGK
jgi:ketosteroid isomerase-like protein